MGGGIGVPLGRTSWYTWTEQTLAGLRDTLNSMSQLININIRADLHRGPAICPRASLLVLESFCSSIRRIHALRTFSIGRPLNTAIVFTDEWLNKIRASLPDACTVDVVPLTYR